MFSRSSKLIGAGIHRLLPGSGFSDDQWKTSFALAVGVHLLVVVLALLSPYIFRYRPRLPEVYTVNLFSATELSAPAPSSAAKTTVTPRKVKKKVESKVQKPAPPPPAPVQKEAVSLKPIRTKKTDLEKLKRLRETLAAQQKAREAEKVAQQIARDAVEKLREALLASSTGAEEVSEVASDPAESSAAAGPPGGDVEVDEATKRYYIEIVNVISQNWKLYRLPEWDENLLAIVVITIRRDGIVRNISFEHQSGNAYYDRDVERAIRESSPLPPFPAHLSQPEMEVGIRFRPKGLF